MVISQLTDPEKSHRSHPDYSIRHPLFNLIRYCRRIYYIPTLRFDFYIGRKQGDEGLRHCRFGKSMMRKARDRRQ